MTRDFGFTAVVGITRMDEVEKSVITQELRE